MSSKRKNNALLSKGDSARPKTSSARAGLSSPKHPANSDSRWVILGICISLASVIWIVFGQTLHFGFTNYDDPVYVSNNAEIVHGFNWRGVAGLFTHTVLFNWHPLTMLSHMLDCQLYALNPGGHHLTSILLHTTTVILLFLLLRQMTGALWRSAFVAAVFAIHPLRVESVAWVAERKDVLSGVFFMLTILAYLRYVRQPSWQRHLLVLLSFALGLMSKPMLVTLPFVLLLLDYWPLRRFELIHFSIPWKFVREKLYLLALSAVFCGVTLFTQAGAQETLPLPQRLMNALTSYVIYLEQMFWPAKLAVLYPFPKPDFLPGKMIAVIMVLVSISVVAWMIRQKRPYFLAGWLWYLGMLVPVIGLCK